MNKEILPVLIIALMFAIAAYVEPMVKTDYEGNMAGNWAQNGKEGGWVNKTVGLYLVPVLTFFIYLILLIVPKIGICRENFGEFERQFWGFKVVLVFVMGVIYVATLLPSIGNGGDPMFVVVAAVSMLFFYVGHMLNYTKRNFSMGVRTPGTLSSEKAWGKTNRLAGKLFWVCGALCLIALVTPPEIRLWMVVGPAILAAIAATAYSYLEYEKTMKEQLAGKKTGITKRKRRPLRRKKTRKL